MSALLGRVRLPLGSGETIMDPNGFKVSVYHHIHLARVSRAELRELSGMVDGRDRLDRIIAWCQVDRLEPHELNTLLIATWREATAAWDVPGVTRSGIVQTFREAGFVTNVRGAKPPAEPMTLYRGAHGPAGIIGFSWTPNRGVAALFAKKAFDATGAGILTETTVEPRHMLAMFDLSRDIPAIEYVVNPFALRHATITTRPITDPELMELSEDMWVQVQKSQVRELQREMDPATGDHAGKAIRYHGHGSPRLDQALVISGNPSSETCQNARCARLRACPWLSGGGCLADTAGMLQISKVAKT